MSARIERQALTEAAATGVEELRQECSLASNHARRRAQMMQQPQSSQLVSAASSVQTRQDEHRQRRESYQDLRNSRSNSFHAKQSDEQRNERLELLEHLERGPRPCQAPIEDPDWLQFEPNSQVKLRSRLIPNSRIASYLDGRYLVTPSLFYSLTNRTGSSNSEYAGQAGSAMDGDVELPLYGDWVLFAVLAEKSPMKYTAARVTEDPPTKDTMAFQRSNPSKSARKFFSCKLLDLNKDIVKTQSQLPGDCILNMVLFDSADSRNQATANSKKTSAFEALWKEPDGMLLAILNPRVWISKHSVCYDALIQKKSRELTITPRSKDSVLAIGQADSYAQCKSIKKDGKRCSSFVLRGKNNQICEYHLEHAVEGRLRARPEFATGTSFVLGKPTKLAEYRPDFRSKRIKPNNISGLQGLEVGSSSDTPYVVSTSNDFLSSSDPRSVGYNVETRYGRQRADRDERKRKHDLQEQRISSMDVGDSSRSFAIEALSSNASASDDQLRSKFVTEYDQNTLAAKTLRIAQATLRGEKSLTDDAVSAPDTKVHKPLTTSRLLARQTAPSSSLPKAKLHAKQGGKLDANSNKADTKQDGPRFVDI
ncbi:hypothetical protein MYAM1_003385 [Malassezia yamatoensis]|uniref:Zinc finger Mcm10/DnaG-type domain-containing protein n=1 Tax=Malassezia yamatoensis TaxID=253288 RepID=A0AAJ6CJC9_9BASI|nr:hypothetical protein MYAM1_003385 [Malassezia yamatoensis]